jgi:hypothetical protein
MTRLILLFVLCASAASYAENADYYKNRVTGKLITRDAELIDAKIRKLSDYSNRADIRTVFPDRFFRISEDTNGLFRFDEADYPRLVVPEFRGFRAVRMYDLASAGSIPFIRLDNTGFFSNTDIVCRIEESSSFGYVIFGKIKNDYIIKAFYFSEENVPGE